MPSSSRVQQRPYTPSTFRRPPHIGRAERTFAQQLRGIARNVGQLIAGYDVSLESLPSLSALLRSYAQALIPWAKRAARGMIAEVNNREQDAWRALGSAISAQLHRDLTNTPLGDRVNQLMEEQVALITSIPIQAAERVHRLTVEGLEDSIRPREVAKQIARSAQVTASRATLIARTETGRTASVLLQARCEEIGATHYVWHSLHDADVRPGHRAMDGKVCEWANPPAVKEDDGRVYHHHPGAIWNCRCVTAETRVDPAGIQQLFRAPYHGALYRVQVAGQAFTCTPNHPILTARGWVAAASLQHGDYLVQILRDPINAVEAHEDDRLPTFAQLFESKAMRSISRSRLEANFHGDLPSGDVDCVAFEQGLALYQPPSQMERISDFALANTYRWIVRAIYSSTRHVRKSHLARLLDAVAQTLLWHLSHGGAISFAPSAQRYALCNQSAIDGPSIDAMLLREREQADATQVFTRDGLIPERFSVVGRPSSSRYQDSDSPEVLAEIVRMNAQLGCGLFEHHAGLYKLLPLEDQRLCEESFSGHIFTLQSVNGRYGVTPSRIVSRNCYATPIINDPYAPQPRSRRS